MVLVLAVGCKQSPVVLDGRIKGYDGQMLTVNISDNFQYDTLAVNTDGTFHFEKNIDDVLPGLLSIGKFGRTRTFFIPGKHYSYDIDLSVATPILEYDCDCPAEREFYDYMNDTLLKVDYAHFVYPDKFSKYRQILDDKMAEAEKRLAGVKDKRALKYFRNTIWSNNVNSKINFASQLEKKGIDVSSDKDYMEYFDSVVSDIREGKAPKSALTLMLPIKQKMYDDTIPASIRYLMAVDEIAPNQAVKDSLSEKQVVSIFKDSKIGSDYEAKALLEVAERLITDEAELNGYRELVEKTMALKRGAEEIDFEFVDTDGKLWKLSDFKGKAVYVDFWATWCIPCCLQIPHMRTLAAKYANDPRIEFISVSFDESQEDWKSMLATDKPAWPQYCALDTGDSIMKDYGFRAIPRFMLFDKEGRIVSANAPRPQDIDVISALIDEIL